MSAFETDDKDQQSNAFSYRSSQRNQDMKIIRFFPVVNHLLQIRRAFPSRGQGRELPAAIVVNAECVPFATQAILEETVQRLEKHQ
jgi:hypothetical protein